MRLLLVAACFLFTAHAHAEIVRVEFEGQLTSVDEGFPISLAEDETIRGHYLIDTGTFFHGVGGLLRDIRIQSVPELTAAGSSGWTIGGQGQTTAIDRDHVPLIPGGINNPVPGQISSTVTAGGQPNPSDGTLNPLLDAVSGFPSSEPVFLDDLYDLANNLPCFFCFFVNDIGTAGQGLDFDADDLIASILGFDRFETAGDLSHFDFSLFGPSAPIRLWFTATEGVAERSLPPALAPGVSAGLTLELADASGQDRSATFQFTRLAVVPEPATIGLAGACALAGLLRRRKSGA